MIKEEFYFDSRDGESRIHAVRYTPDELAFRQPEYYLGFDLG